MDITHNEARINATQPGISLFNVRNTIISTNIEHQTWYTILQVYEMELWILFTFTTLFMVLLLTLSSAAQITWQNFFMANIAAVKAICAQSFDQNFFTKVNNTTYFRVQLDKPLKFIFPYLKDKNHVKSNSILILCLSMNGTFMFWCFTGILTSLIAIQIEEPPLKTLNDLHSKSNFKLMTYGGGITEKRMMKWAEETENLKSFERSIKAISFTKEHFEEAKNPNVAIILEDFGVKTWMEKCNISDMV